MISRLLSWLFGCVHARTTFPQSRPVRPGSSVRITTVCCLDCAAEFAYDWRAMRRGPRLNQGSQQREHVALAHVEAAAQ